MSHLVIENIEPRQVSFDTATNIADLNFTIEVAETASLDDLSFNIARYAFCAKANYTSEVDSDTSKEYLETLDFTEVVVFKYLLNSNDSIPVMLSPEQFNNFESRVYEEASVCFYNR